MKALGVVHFKGNWTNIGKQKENKTKNYNKNKNPQVISDEQSSLKQVRTSGVCACVCLCVCEWVGFGEGGKKLFLLLGRFSGFYLQCVMANVGSQSTRTTQKNWIALKDPSLIAPLEVNVYTSVLPSSTLNASLRGNVRQ